MDRCWAFCLAYNESVLIPFWVRHYRTFCERVMVYVDRDTNDGTGSLALREGAYVRFHDTGSRLDDFGFVTFAQGAYKEARGQAQWVLWVDADEFLSHPTIKEHLDTLRGKGVTLARTEGYAMLADEPPIGRSEVLWHLYDDPQYRHGVPAPAYAKPVLFDPALDVTWTAGKHQASWAPPAVEDATSEPVKLLHYRWFGREWCEERNARNYARIDEANRAARHGSEVYPGASGEYSPVWYADRVAEAAEVL